MQISMVFVIVFVFTCWYIRQHALKVKIICFEVRIFVAISRHSMDDWNEIIKPFLLISGIVFNNFMQGFTFRSMGFLFAQMRIGHFGACQKSSIWLLPIIQIILDSITAIWLSSFWI